MSLTTAWRDAQLRHLVSEPIQNGLGEAAAEGDPSWPRYIRITDIVSMTELDPDKVETLAPEIAGKAPVRRGDLLCAAVGASVGTSYLHESDEAACYAGYLVRIRPDLKNLEPRFLGYWAQSAEYWQQIRAGSIGSTIENFSASRYRSMRLSIPEVGEQRRIAEFLDRETAQIDELIAKQEQLISTLAERLDSRWSELFIGLEREHGLTPVRRLIRSIVDGPFGSSLTSAHYVDEGHRVIRLGNLGTWAFKDTDKAYIDSEYAATLASHAVRAGDVLVAGLGDEKMPLGRACVAPDNLGPAIVKADCYRVRTARGVDPNYLAWALSSPLARDQFQLLSRGTTRSRLNTTVVREARVPLPGVSEQTWTTAEFRELMAKHEGLVATANEVKSLLAERRQALISAAVTGKIDVGGAS